MLVVASARHDGCVVCAAPALMPRCHVPLPCYRAAAGYYKPTEGEVGAGDVGPVRSMLCALTPTPRRLSPSPKAIAAEAGKAGKAGSRRSRTSVVVSALGGTATADTPSLRAAGALTAGEADAAEIPLPRSASAASTRTPCDSTTRANASMTPSAWPHPRQRSQPPLRPVR